MQRLCTAAEIKFYFNSFYQSGGEAKKASFLKPNKNCNLSSWVSGCEPGWACSVGKDKKVDLKNSKDMPVRVQTCLPCCEGFFCPRGITCLIRKYLVTLRKPGQEFFYICHLKIPNLDFILLFFIHY